MGQSLPPCFVFILVMILREYQDNGNLYKLYMAIDKNGLPFCDIRLINILYLDDIVDEFIDIFILFVFFDNTVI